MGMKVMVTQNVETDLDITNGARCRDCPVSRCVELLIVVLTLDSYLSLCRLVLAY